MAYTLGKIIGIILIIYIISKIFGGGKKSTDAKDASTTKTTTSTQAKKSTPKTGSKAQPAKATRGSRWAGKVSHATPDAEEMPTDGTWDDAYNYIQYLLTINDSLPTGSETKAAKQEFKYKGFSQFLAQKVTELWDDANLVNPDSNDDPIVGVSFYVAADAVLMIFSTQGGGFATLAYRFCEHRKKYDQTAAAHPEIPMGPSFARLSSKAEVEWLGEMIAAEANDVPSLEYVKFLTYNIDASKCGQLDAVRAEKARKAAQAEAARKSAPAKPSGSTGAAKKKPAAPKGGTSGSKPKSDLEAQMDTLLKSSSGKGADAEKSEKPVEPPKPKKPAGPSQAQIDGLMARIIAYYTEMWNPKTGSLYKELDVSMPIDHFSIQLKADRLVDSVWLSGDELPLVSETAYTDLPGASELTSLPKSVKTTALQTALIALGTVTYDEQNDLYYPIHKKTPQEPPKADGKSARKPMSDLEAQMQAMLDKDKKK